MTILLLPEELEMGLLRPKYTKLDLVLLQNVYRCHSGFGERLFLAFIIPIQSL